MAERDQRFSICPIENCEFVQEFDPEASAFCPDCGMELISECPGCQAPLVVETQTTCLSCGVSLKE